MFSKSKYLDVLNSLSENIIFDISPSVFEKIAYRENSDGIVALAKPKQHGLDDLKISIILYYNFESVEKPGNPGAVLELLMRQLLMLLLFVTTKRII